jgi:antitoxin component YwqK of YwqJK toxin-antitoxin module
MRKIIIITIGLLTFSKGFSQLDTPRNLYANLDTIETYDVGLRNETGPEYARYFVNDKQVEKLTYEYYDKVWHNFTKCKPCFLKVYDLNNTLLRGTVQYSDCAVGLTIEYYQEGQIKLIGHYKENKTGSWNDFVKKGYCSIRHGAWRYYDDHGKLIKVEQYIDGKLVN